jgi:hypothetical protein
MGRDAVRRGEVGLHRQRRGVASNARSMVVSKEDPSSATATATWRKAPVALSRGRTPDDDDVRADRRRVQEDDLRGVTVLNAVGELDLRL